MNKSLVISISIFFIIIVSLYFSDFKINFDHEKWKLHSKRYFMIESIEKKIPIFSTQNEVENLLGNPELKKSQLRIYMYSLGKPFLFSYDTYWLSAFFDEEYKLIELRVHPD